jgi:phosphopantothenate synthetase
VRSIPTLVETVEKLKNQGMGNCREILRNFNNGKNLAKSMVLIRENLSKFAAEGATERGRAM